MYEVGDRVILAFEPVVGESGTVQRVSEEQATVLLDAVGDEGQPILAFISLKEKPVDPQQTLFD